MATDQSAFSILSTELHRIEQNSIQKQSCATVKNSRDSPCHTCNFVARKNSRDKIARENCRCDIDLKTRRGLLERRRSIILLLSCISRLRVVRPWSHRISCCGQWSLSWSAELSRTVTSLCKLNSTQLDKKSPVFCRSRPQLHDWQANWRHFVESSRVESSWVRSGRTM